MILSRIQQKGIMPIIVASILVAAIISYALLSMDLLTAKTAKLASQEKRKFGISI
jgi:hypothetical protein